MITASEALKLSQGLSQGNFIPDKMLKALDGEIRAAAMNGKQEYIVRLNGFWESYPIGVIEPLPTQRQIALIQHLSEFGFSASVEKLGVPYAPAGADYPKGLLFQQYVIKVRW